MSSMEVLLTNFSHLIDSQIHKDVMQQTLLNDWLVKKEELQRENKYYINPRLAALLESKGILTNPLALDLHPHPANKKIEEYCFFSLLPYLIKGDFTLAYSKVAKALKLLEKLIEGQQCELRNNNVEVKDYFRYSIDYIVAEPLQDIQTSTLVLHDALHFYQPEAIYQTFVDNPKLHTILATTIIPPESIYKHKSLWPELYNLTYKNDDLIYTPEGDHSGSYTQPLSAKIWLLINRICGQQVNLQVTLLESRFAHHIIAITRSDLMEKKYNNFGEAELYWVDDFFVHDYNMEDRVVSKRVYDLLDSYAQSIKTLTFLNVKCKLRTLVADNKGSSISPQMFTFLAYLVFSKHNNNKFVDEEYKVLHSKFSDQLRRGLRQLWQFLTFQDTTEELNQKILQNIQPTLVDYVFELKPYLVLVNAKTYVKQVILQQINPEFYHTNRFIERFLKNQLSLRTKPYSTMIEHFAINRHICEKQDQLNDEESIVSEVTPSLNLSEEVALEQDLEVTSNHSDETTLSFATTISNPENEEILNIEDTIERLQTVRELLEVNHQHRTLNQNANSQQPEAENNTSGTWAEQSLQPDADENEFLDITGNGILDELEVEIAETPRQTRAEVKKMLKRILKSGVGCGFKTLVLLLGEEKVITAMMLLMKNDDASLLLGKQTVELTQAKGNARARSCTVGDFIDFEKILDVKFTFHLYSNERKRYNCTNNVDDLHVYHHGNNHWTTRRHNHQACLAQEAITTIPKNQNIKPTTMQELIRRKRRGKNDLLDPEFIHFKKYNVTLQSRNEYEVKNLDGVKRNGRISMIELGQILDNNPQEYQATRKRADLYCREMKNGTTGTIARQNLERAKAIDALVNSQVTSKPVKIIVRVGRGGCRKTQALVDYLNKKENGVNIYTVVVPKTKLRREWNDRLIHERKYTVKTFETALLQAPADTVIFDEVSQFAPGYIDTFLRTWGHVKNIILLFDLIQTEFHEPHPDSVLNYQIKEEANFAKFATVYENYTFRTPQKLARFLGYRSYSQIEGSVFVENKIDGSGQILTCDELSVKNLEGSGYSAITISSSQGSTINALTELIINHSAKRANEAVLNTALTRAAGDFQLTVDEDPDEVDLRERYKANPFLHALLGGDQYQFQDLIPLTFEEYQLSKLLMNVETTTPPVDYETVKARLTQPLKNAEAREVLVGGEYTNQIRGEPLSIQQIFLKHQQRDSATWKLTKEKRLRYSTTADMERRLKSSDTKELAAYLEDGFWRITKLDGTEQEFDQELFSDLQRKYYEKKLRSKPIHQMKNNQDRSLNDESINAIRLFLKGQTVGKLEKMYSEAKAGQSIACFKDAALITLAPIADYLYEKIVVNFPEHIFVNLKKNTKDFDSWVQRHWSLRGKKTENDYEAFDQSQTEETLAFELRIMRRYSIPEELIEFYTFLKLNAKTQAGLLDIMRLTGEWCTFLFNTFCNLAYLGMKFNEFRRRDLEIPLAVGGDDMVADAELTETKVFKRIGNRYKLKSKLKVTEKATFCGWQLHEQGIYKNPTLLFAKLAAKADVKQFANAIIGYAFDAAWLYSGYELFCDQLTEEEREYHKAFIRWVVKSGLNMTSICKHIYDDYEEDDETLQLAAGKDDKILQNILDRYVTMSYENKVEGKFKYTPLLSGRSLRSAQSDGVVEFKTSLTREQKIFLEGDIALQSTFKKKPEKPISE